MSKEDTEPAPSVVDERLLLPTVLIAKTFGVTSAAVGQWDIQPHRRDGRMTLYYLPDVARWRIDNLMGERLDLNKERALLARAQREKTEIDIAARRGELVPREEVEQDAFKMGSMVRDRLMALPPRLGPEMAGIDEPNEAEAVLEDEIRGALEGLAGDAGTKKKRSRRKKKARSKK